MLLQLYMCACLLRVLASFVCLPPSCACLLRVLASFVCLPPSCACLLRVLASFVCLPPSCACLLRVLASFVCLPPSCACLSSMCLLSSLHRVSLDYSINVCAVIYSSSVFATTSCKENTLITFLISTLKSLH